MAAHQYWRLTGFLTDSNALELSQAQLYDGVQLIAQAPTFTVPPTTGTAFPDVLRWNDFSMPGFALVWDLSTPVEAPSLRLGAGSNAATFPSELYCQYSDDGKFWSTSDAPVNIAFPGAVLLTAEPGMILTSTQAPPEVKLLFEGALTDKSISQKTVTALGGVSLSAVQSKFDIPSIAFNGAGSRLSVPNSADLDLRDKNFRVRFWVYLSEISNWAVIYAKRSSGASYAPLVIQMGGNELAGQLTFALSTSSSSWVRAASGPFPVGVWKYVEFLRDGTVGRLFLDGSLVSTVSVVGSLITNDLPVTIGADGDGADGIKGYLGAFELAVNVAGSTADYQPPTTPFYEAAIPFIPLGDAPPGRRWSGGHMHVEGIAGSELPAGVAAGHRREHSFADAYHGGRGLIRATVKQKNTPVNTPLRRRIDLLDERSRLVIRSTWSDPVTGIYTFLGIREDLGYTVVSYDLLHDKRAVIADNLTLANGGVELLP